MSERLRIIKQALYLSNLAQGKPPDTGEEQQVIAMSFAYALDDIPTHHLEECFQRAIRHPTDDFHLTAAAVNRAYTDMLPELQRQAQANAARQEFLLRSGQGSLGYMSVVEYKARHNLPEAWRPGDPYPAESDLYGKAAPPQPEAVYKCATCKDAHWVKYYPRERTSPELMPCPNCR